MTRIRFLAADSAISVANAAGIPEEMLDELPRCELLPGDVIAYPAPVGLAYRVVSRFFAPASLRASATWWLTLEQTTHPLEARIPGEPLRG